MKRVTLSCWDTLISPADLIHIILYGLGCGSNYNLIY